MALPDNGAVAVAHDVGAVEAIAQRPGADVVKLRTRVVDAPGKLRVIGRMRRVADVEEVVALGERIAVEEHGFGAAFSRRPAVERMFRAFMKAFVIGVRPIRLGNFAVILLDAAAHFGHQRPSQILERRHDAIAVSVFRLDQLGDVDGKSVGIAQHLAPVFGGKPVVRIIEHAAMDDSARVALRGDGRRRACKFESPIR